MRLFKWLRTQFQMLFLLPDYFRALAKEWVSIIFGETLVGVAFVIWWALANPQNPKLIFVFVTAMFVAGYYAWRSVCVRLEPLLVVTRVAPQEWIDERLNLSFKLYFLEIFNLSEGVSVLDIHVKLADINPSIQGVSWLPVPLRQKHDQAFSTQALKSFDLHPKEVKHIDFIQSSKGSESFYIHHLIPGAVNQVRFDGGRRQLRVTITGKDTPPLSKVFEVWADGEGVLQCSMLRTS